jgi:glycosyltransferase involved in cell wall biosynthesis
MKPDLPVISVVTVCFNCVSEIEQTIDSVVQQSYTNIEYIVVDGCSTDGTFEILSNRSSCISKLISEEDAGLYDAMNKGKRLATGDFVFFLNAGDIFTDVATLSSLVARMRDWSAIYFGRVEIRSSIGAWLTPNSHDPMNMQKKFLPHHQSIFYPRVFFVHTEYDLSYRVQADVDFTTKAMLSTKAIFVGQTIAISHLGGYTLLTFSSWRRTLRISEEFVRIARENGLKMAPTQVFFLYIKQICKFFAYKLSGEKLLFKLMRRAALQR